MNHAPQGLARDIHLTGMDKDPAMLAHARRNAASLGFGGCAVFVEQDVSVPDPACHQRYDLVLANPPFRDGSGGRLSAEERRQARFESSANTEAFVAFAARALRTRGKLALVHLPERLDEVLACCMAVGLAPKRLRFVHGKADREARIMLLEAVRGGGRGLVVEPPLMLYARGQGATAMTGEALKFCPWLQCNG